MFSAKNGHAIIQGYVVCGFRVKVWESSRISRSFGYGYGSVTELTEVPGIVARAYKTHRSCAGRY